MRLHLCVCIYVFTCMRLHALAEMRLNMYLRILKKDLRRKKTMNFILLIFILLAAMFIASSTNNMLTISTALDSYLEKANVPDYWFAISQEKVLERFDRFAKEHDYHYDKTKLIQLDPDDITVSGKAFEYRNTTCISTIGGTKVFDKNAQEITHINDGEIYITAAMFQSEDNDFYEGCKIELTSGGLKKEFTL